MNRMVLAVFLLLVSVELGADETETKVSFGRDSVIATGVTAGATVVFFCVALQPDGFDSTVLRWAETRGDADFDRTVVLDLGRPLPWKSIWAVVELPSTTYTIATPHGFPLRRTDFESQVIRRGPSGRVDLLTHNRPFVDLLYVHPDGGAWTTRAADGYASDRDGHSDGRTTVALDQLRSLIGGDHPKEFASGGLVVAIDLYQMDVATLRLDATLLAEVLSEN